jgi:hypothetical protein
LLLALVLFLAPGAAAPATAAPAPAAAPAAAALTSPPVAANILGNRTRMIQLAIIVMCIGIAFLMWGKQK